MYIFAKFLNQPFAKLYALAFFLAENGLRIAHLRKFIPAKYSTNILRTGYNRETFFH